MHPAFASAQKSVPLAGCFASVWLTSASNPPLPRPGRPAGTAAQAAYRHTTASLACEARDSAHRTACQAAGPWTSVRGEPAAYVCPSPSRLLPRSRRPDPKIPARPRSEARRQQVPGMRWHRHDYQLSRSTAALELDRGPEQGRAKRRALHRGGRRGVFPSTTDRL
ncbi:uncharacterized protein PSFLO_02496 [Pseudozyma flocculosa]|uniref:Uncharacterized protein n=1 Tax=Pseudozyma flocculosa TaxID=84751 RepID=A0A5C3EXQ5_9BASI|nr:uncharacterized protein PSFLO_02496 [Pseudozyma flocculosa]